MSQNNPKFSVIIPCYNYADFLPLSVGSVLEQSFSDFELIIVDDGSTDNSLQVAKGLVEDNPNFEIRVISQKNTGQPAITRNNGINEARAPYILCLDADDMIDAHFLRKCNDALTRDQDISVIYTDAIFFDTGGSEVKQSGEFRLELLVITNQLFCCSLFTKEAWTKSGGFKTNVRGYEDWDFWIGLSELGVKGHKISEPLFFYRTGKDGLFVTAQINDEILKANVILNHPNLFDEVAKNWASLMVSEVK